MHQFFEFTIHNPPSMILRDKICSLASIWTKANEHSYDCLFISSLQRFAVYFINCYLVFSCFSSSFYFVFSFGGRLILLFLYLFTLSYISSFIQKKLSSTLLLIQLLFFFIQLGSIQLLFPVRYSKCKRIFRNPMKMGDTLMSKD